jgi:hypothetical protein
MPMMIVLIKLEGGEVIPVYSQINKLRTYVATPPRPLQSGELVGRTNRDVLLHWVKLCTCSREHPAVSRLTYCLEES